MAKVRCPSAEWKFLVSGDSFAASSNEYPPTALATEPDWAYADDTAKAAAAPSATVVITFLIGGSLPLRMRPLSSAAQFYGVTIGGTATGGNWYDDTARAFFGVQEKAPRKLVGHRMMPQCDKPFIANPHPPPAKVAGE